MKRGEKYFLKFVEKHRNKELQKFSKMTKKKKTFKVSSYFLHKPPENYIGIQKVFVGHTI